MIFFVVEFWIWRSETWSGSTVERNSHAAGSKLKGSKYEFR